MKSRYHLILGALALAISCGAAGYMLGKIHAPGANQARSGKSINERQHEPTRAGGPLGKQRISSSEIRAQLEAEPSPLVRLRLASSRMEAWIATDPQDALAWLMSQQMSARRAEILRIALNQFAENDPLGAAEWVLKNLDGVDLNNSLILIAEQWAQSNGQQAADWFFKQAPGSERDGAVEQILFAWASNDPNAAVDYLKSKPPIENLTPALQRAALAGWAKSEPEAAAIHGLEMSRTANDPSLFGITLANWATVDLSASSHWLHEHVPAGDERAFAAQHLAKIYAQQSPADGVSWLPTLATGVERNGAAGILAASWSQADAVNAAKWAASQTVAQLPPDSMVEIGHNLLRTDPAFFTAWSQSLPDGPAKQQMSQFIPPAASE